MNATGITARISKSVANVGFFWLLINDVQISLGGDRETEEDFIPLWSEFQARN